MVFDGVQLVGGRVAALSGEGLLGVVRPGAARDVDVAPAEVAASLERQRGGRDAVDDDTGGEEVRVLEADGNLRLKPGIHPQRRIIQRNIKLVSQTS